MKKVHKLNLVVALCSWALIGKADYFVDYYRVSKEPVLNIITIDKGVFRGRLSHDRARKNKELLRKCGIFFHDSARKEAFTRTFTLEGHNVEVVLSVNPPRGHGPGGANETGKIVIKIDGDVVLELPFGHSSHDPDIEIAQITIYGDGVLAWNGSARKEDAWLAIEGHGFFSTPEEKKRKVSYESIEQAIRRSAP